MKLTPKEIIAAQGITGVEFDAVAKKIAPGWSKVTRCLCDNSNCYGVEMADRVYGLFNERKHENRQRSEQFTVRLYPSVAKDFAVVRFMLGYSMQQAIEEAITEWVKKSLPGIEAEANNAGRTTHKQIITEESEEVNNV